LIDYQKEKVDLSIQKVELGIAQDIAKMNSKAKSLVKKSDSLIDKITKSINAYDKLYTSSVTLRNEALEEVNYSNKKLKEATSAAKELGVKPQEIEGFSELSESIVDLERQTNKLRFPSIK
tara:strand:+ start:374 stop:736 length:363 start_codon:yes stop_codon:yes gene_type:complete